MTKPLGEHIDQIIDAIGVKKVGDIIQRHKCGTDGCSTQCYGRFCEECEERMAKARDERERQVKESIRAQIIQRRIANSTDVIRQMGVPEAMWNFTFAGMKDKYPSYQKIKPVQVALDKGLGILIYPETKTGAIGNGKSRLAIGGLYYLACQNDLPLNQFGFIDCARWTYFVNNLDKRERDEVIDDVVRKQYLVIDDVGWEGIERKDIMRMLFRERYNQGQINLITTNFKISKEKNKFSEFYSLDVWDRIKSSSQSIAVGGGSLR